MENPIINGLFLVEKRTAESGFKYSNWTYVVINDFPLVKRTDAATIRVRGFIDSYEFKQYNLLPMKDNAMLLPIKASIRKKIGKKEGDYVQVILYTDDSPIEIPDDILACLLDSPKAYQYFLTLSDSNQKYYIDWIEESKKMETKVERLLKTIERLENGLKFYDWKKQSE